MPAKDKYHDAVINALKKEGWTIASEQILLAVDNRNMWVDIQATKEADERVILVEVKGFEAAASIITYLQSVVGQYMVYKVALDYLGISYPLYLAVPEDAYYGILNEEIGKLVLKAIQIPLLVFDANKEEIRLWQP